MKTVVTTRVHTFDSQKILDRVFSVWIFSACILVGVMLLDSDRFSSIVKLASGALISTLPYIFIAVLMVAYLKASNAESVVAKAFAGRESRMIIMADGESFGSGTNQCQQDFKPGF